MAEMLQGVSETGVYRLLENCMNSEDPNVIGLLQQTETADSAMDQTASTRGITGVRAEELFVDWHNGGGSVFDGPLRDCREHQCGYDFESRYEGETVYIEVKELKGETGGILFTDREWSVATENGDQYFVVLLRSVDSDSPGIEIFRNPAATFSGKQIVTTVVQVSWSVAAVHSSDAVGRARI